MRVQKSCGNSNRKLSGWQKVRPIRIAFLVENSENIELILDAIFADGYSRWGGRFSLIVPCEEGSIVDDYWPWLEAYDPDIVYSYVNLSSVDVLDIHERLTPADYISHKIKRERPTEVGDFQPLYGFEILSSLSTVFSLARHSPIGNDPKIKIIDSWFTEKPTRLLTDNFGTYRTSTYSGTYPNDALEIAGLLTVASDENFRNSPQFVPRELDRISDEYSAFHKFLNRHATCMSLLSARQSSHLELNDPRWSGSFNLVIGDSFEDRMLFWNARHFIPTWLDGSLCCLRVTRMDLEDAEFVQLLALLINTHNHIKAGGGQEQLCIRSASHDESTLLNVLSRLKAAHLLIPASVEVVLGGHAIPSDSALRLARIAVHAFFGDANDPEGKEFHWDPPTATPPKELPVHLKDAPPNQVFTLGHWAVDLDFEHDLENSRYGKGNLWMLSKRWRLASAFRPHFDSRGFHLDLFSTTRTSRYGALAVFPSLTAVLESITVPNIDNAINHALCSDSAPRQLFQNDPVWPERKVQWMRPSNEAQYLIGVLGLTGGLTRACELLLHPFLTKLLADFGGTPNIADSDLVKTMNWLQKRATRFPLFDVSNESERGALAQLLTLTAKSMKNPKVFISLNAIKNRWKDYCEASIAERSNSIGVIEVSEDEETLEQDRTGITSILGEMRLRRMLFQGYPWKCDTCQHRNWTDFTALKAMLPCDVCSTEKELPVEIPWNFRANEFLIESLRAHSVLSLVWLLDYLRNSAKKSFLYLGPVSFGYDDVYDTSDREADLLAIVDGQTVLCEVKSAWRSLRKIDLTSFIELSLRLRPDCAILAIMENLKDKKLDDDIENVKRQLSKESIKFELLTTDKHIVDGQPDRLV
ncbi:hypothetical protein ACO0K9_15525 [Undibacterium sp. Ji50W]|uniref:hypothetical protein n=1 Tax=Undibacterium sp. Ji50W TaxID=3413041 RepID=UPI003BF3F21E